MLNQSILNRTHTQFLNNNIIRILISQKETIRDPTEIKMKNQRTKVWVSQEMLIQKKKSRQKLKQNLKYPKETSRPSQMRQLKRIKILRLLRRNRRKKKP